MPTNLKARIVLPVDRPPIEGGVVTVDAERIVAISENAIAGPIRDLGDVALLPALVNAHTHLEFSHLRRPLGQPGMRLVDWIRLVIAERGQRPDQTLNSIAAGREECVVSGALAIGDIVTAPLGGESEGSRSRFDGVHFLEVIGFSHARAASAFSAVEERLASAPANYQTQIGISPHAPYTVSPQLLNSLVSLANVRHLPVAMHLAESREELQLLADGSGPFQELLDQRSMWDDQAIPHGSRPLDYLRQLAAAPRALVIHGNYLDEEEHTFLAANSRHMSLVYCPRTHAYFGHSPYPLQKLLAMGVSMALGTDSRASNPDLNMLSEVRFAAKAHTNVAPSDFLRMATLGGATALGCDERVGSLTPGKLASFIALPLPPGMRGDAEELLAAVLDSNEQPAAVFLRGEEVGGRSSS